MRLDRSRERRNDAKVLLVYKDVDNQLQVESVWATRVGKNYRIDNVPFYAKNIAYGDIVSVDENNGALYFDSLVTPSGHSTVHIVFFDGSAIDEVQKALVDLGCGWEGSQDKTYIAVDVPPNVDYEQVKRFLEEGLKAKRFDYAEACLGFKE